MIDPGFPHRSMNVATGPSDEGQDPATFLIAGYRQQHRCPCDHGPLPTTPAPDMRFFLTMRAELAPVTYRMALALRQDMQAVIPNALSLVCHGHHAFA